MDSQRRSQYIIEMDDNQTYPYKGQKDSSFEVVAKCKIDFDKQGKIHSSIQKILSINSPFVITLVEVTESYLSNSYTLVYQYVPYPLKYSHQKIKKFVTSQQCLRILEQLFCLLLKKGITPILDPKCFGFTSDFSIKYYIHHRFTEFPKTNHNKVLEAAKNYAQQCQQMLQIYGTPKSLIDRVHVITNKINTIRSEVRLNLLKVHQRSDSKEKPNESQISEPLPRIIEPSHSTNSGDKEGLNFEDSYSLRQEKKNKKVRAMSFHEQNPKTQKNTQQKTKKTSWVQQTKQKSSGNQESERASMLHKRITNALMKTEKTLQRYERIRSKSSKRRRGQKNL